MVQTSRKVDRLRAERIFTHKYGIALKEARETLYWLKLIARSDLLPSTRLAELTRECDEIIAVLTTIIKKTKKGNS